jgi:hypothetical protein
MINISNKQYSWKWSIRVKFYSFDHFALYCMGILYATCVTSICSGKLSTINFNDAGVFIILSESEQYN